MMSFHLCSDRALHKHMDVVIERVSLSGEKGAKAVTDRRQGMCHQAVPDQQKA